MSHYSTIALGPSHVDSAARLLARGRAERLERCPLLEPALADPAEARRIVEGYAGSASALFRDGVLAGFLRAEKKEDADWGSAVESGVDDWAFAEGLDSSAAALLYAAAFDPLANGVYEHRLYCPADDVEALRTWFLLGFGVEQAYAAARLDELEAEAPGIEGIEIRRARAGDEDALAGLSPLIATMQAGPPVWAPAPESYLSAIREGYRGLATDPEAIALIAWEGSRALGFLALFPMEGRAEGRAAELPVAGTLPEERGRGLGLALTAAGIEEARRSGFTSIFLDWRTTNPLASSFWRARGFKPYLYRLSRRLPTAAL